MTISLVALVGLYKKVGKSSKQASKQAINQHFDSMTTTAQRAAVVKTWVGGQIFLRDHG